MADTSDFAGQDFTVEIHNPKGEKIVSDNQKADAYGGIEGEYDAAGRRHAGRLRLYSVKPEAMATLRAAAASASRNTRSPNSRSRSTPPTEPVMLGEKIAATHQGQVLLRLAGHQGQGEVQGQCARATTERVVSLPAAGIGSTGRGYWWFACDYDWYPGWRHWGCLRPIPFWWPHAATAAGTGRRAGGRHRRRRHGEGRDRHGRGQGHPRRPGPQLHDHGRGGRRLAADDRRHGQRAGGPQAVHGLRLGRSRLLPRGRHDPRQLRRPHARRQAGRGQRRADAAADHLRRASGKAGRDARANLEARRPTPRARPSSR